MTSQVRELWAGELPHGQGRLLQKSEGLSLMVGREEVYSFASDGQLQSIFQRGDFYQRGLGGRWLHKGRRPSDARASSPMRRFRQPLAPERFEALYAELQTYLNTIEQELVRHPEHNPEHSTAKSELARSLKLLQAWTPERYQERQARFEAIYAPISILPPDQYLSIVLQLTLGCSYNRCAFCNFYKDRRFRIKSEAEFAAHVQAVYDFLGPLNSQRKGIFLADGDALMTPMPRLKAALETLRQHYPDLPLYSFMDAFRPTAKRGEDWRQLAQWGLKRVYLGIETGNAELLDFLGKPGSPELMAEQARLMKANGVALGLILMVGAGGTLHLDNHFQDSIQWLSHLDLDGQDMIFLSAFVGHADQPYVAQLEAAGGQLLSEARLDAELSRWRQALKPLPARVVPYHLQEFIY